MPKDYYKILGVEKNAAPDDIKKAFRKLAHQYHPDKQGGSEEKFKEINEAYQVLGDAEKRKKFDQFGSDFEQQGGFGGAGNWEDFMRSARGQGGNGGFQFDFGGMDMNDVFGDLFGGGRGQRGGRARGQDIQVDVQIEFKEAAFGVEKEIRLTKQNNCDVCSGNGVEPGSTLKNCTVCHGRGQVQQVQRTIFGAMQTNVVCGNCGGRGQIPEKKCKHCSGDGRVKGESKIKVKIPGGIDNGNSIRLSGYGESGGASGEAGDLYVVVHVRPDSRLERDGEDVYGEVNISYSQAVLGDTVQVETLDGFKGVKIPEGTQSHQQIRLRGLGIKSLHGSNRGDHYVKVIITVPKKVSKQAKKLLEDLKTELK